MYPGFDADDMVKRGFLSSLMPFRRKSLRPQQPEQTVARPSVHHPPVYHQPSPIPVPVPVPCPPPQIVVNPQEPHYVPPPMERTQQDIFREIVTECAQLERSTTTTPFSELSCPTSPRTPLAPCPSPMAFPMGPIPSPLPQMFPTQLYDPMMFPTHFAPPPPPYSPEEGGYIPQHGYPVPPIMVSQDPQMPNAVLLEEVVKMVVTAMKQSSIDEGQRESPEEILRRKRSQNNEAAARYRKRQRAARERAEEELSLLSKRNDDLRSTVDHMESEIEQLKQLVLQNRQ